MNPEPRKWRVEENLDDSEIADFVFRIIVEKSELSDLAEEIRQLFLRCKTQDEVEVVKHVLHNLFIYNSEQLHIPLSRLASQIREVVAEKQGSGVAVTAMAWDGSSDSSQSMIHLLKPQLRDLESVELINSVPNYGKTIAKNPTCILVDEFAGTGKTIENRVKWIKNAAAGQGVEIDLRVVILFGMETAREYLQLEGIRSEFYYEMPAGLSGHFAGTELYKFTSAMKSLEARLASFWKGKPLPSLGHGGAEALFAISKQNTPNSNFPILWWPKAADDSELETLLVRYEP